MLYKVVQSFPFVFSEESTLKRLSRTNHEPAYLLGKSDFVILNFVFFIFWLEKILL